MPNIRSAAKRMRSDAKKRANNLATTSELKNLWKKLTLAAGDPAKAQETAKEIISRLDRAVTRGIIPQGRADRKKSRVSRFLQKIKK